MYIAFHLGWWIVPAIIAGFSILILPKGSSGFAVGGIGLLVAAAFVLGHYVTIWLR